MQYLPYLRKNLSDTQYSDYWRKTRLATSLRPVLRLSAMVPEEAIQYGKSTKNKKRYRHPDISLRDMMAGMADA